MGERPIPLLDLRAQYEGLRGEIAQALERVLETQQFALGPEVEALEAELAAYCGVRHAIGCGSGSDALWLALAALGVGPGDEVLCPAYTFFATAGSVARLGARPVFADIDPASFLLDPDAAARAARGCRRLRAIVPVHLFGRPCEIGPLRRLAQELGASIVEDAAQAIGARDASGRPAGSLGRLGCFSFFPSKNLGAYGEGGLVTTDDDELAERVRMLRVHGACGSYRHRLVGTNSRLDAIQAAVLRVKLRHLEEWTAARRARASAYDRAFHEAGAAPSTVPLGEGGLPLRTPAAPLPPARHVYHQYVIRVPAERRDVLRAHLAERGIASAVYYPLGLHLQECFASLGYREGDLPETERSARESLALPLYPELSPAQQQRVVAAVLEGLRK